MRESYEVYEALKTLRYKSKKGLIPAYEASLCIGVLEWVQNNQENKSANKSWFNYRLKGSNVEVTLNMNENGCFCGKN